MSASAVGWYRKRPVVIEAVRWEGDVAIFAEWMDRFGSIPIQLRPLPDLTIATLEGAMTVSPGDWIIRGVQGEFYPCKPDIFAQTYEPVLSDAGKAHE